MEDEGGDQTRTQQTYQCTVITCMAMPCLKLKLIRECRGMRSSILSLPTCVAEGEGGQLHLQVSQDSRHSLSFIGRIGCLSGFLATQLPAEWQLSHLLLAREWKWCMKYLVSSYTHMDACGRGAIHRTCTHTCMYALRHARRYTGKCVELSLCGPGRSSLHMPS